MAKPQINRAPSAVCVDANREIGAPGPDAPVNAHHENSIFIPRGAPYGAWQSALKLLFACGFDALRLRRFLDFGFSIMRNR
jgi:hypothetical protein